jgi:hypothetical protein
MALDDIAGQFRATAFHPSLRITATHGPGFVETLPPLIG